MRAVDAALDLLTPSVLLPAYRMLTKDRTQAYVRNVERIIGASREKILAHQETRVREVCRVAGSRSSFYRNRFAGAGVDPDNIGLGDLPRLPLLEKDDLRDRSDEILAAGVERSTLRQSATGGTTASPITFWMDWDAEARRRSAAIAFDKWVGYEPGLPLALLWGARQDLPASLSWKDQVRKRIISRNLFLPSSVLDDTIMEGFARQIDAFRPRLLQTYPSPLEIFAQFLLRRGIRLDVPAITCTAETLFPHQIDTIERAFGVTPFNWYGSRECGRVATECRFHNGMHINAYGLFVEVLEEDRFEQPGTGQIVITDLWNTSFPMIRYRTGDVGRIDVSRCECGLELPRIVEVCGRMTDVFINSKRQRIPGVAFTNRIITESDVIEEMQILQHDYRRFEILIKPGPHYTVETEIWIGECLDEFIGESVVAKFELVREIPHEKSGKLRFCKNLMPADAS